MVKCALDIKKDIVDKVGEMLSKRGAYVNGNAGYFPNPNMATRAWEVNKEFGATVVKDGEKGSFFIDPPEDLVNLYFDEYKKNEGPYTEQDFRPEGFYMGDESLAEQEKRDLFFQVGNGAVFTERMKERLLAFLKALKIKVEFNADEILNSRDFKRNPLAAFDVLQKFMAFASGQEKLLPQQVAAVMYTFLGKKSILSKALWREIRNWDGYEKMYSLYDKNTSSDDNINIEDDISGEDFDRNSRFNPFAHKMAIIKFLEESLMKAEAGERATKKRLNEDVDKYYFLRRGRLDVYEKDISPLVKIYRQIYNWFQDLLGQPLFEKYDRNDLTQIGLDIAEDVLKGDYTKFIRNIIEKDNKLYDSDGTELELKDYADTLDKDVTASDIITKLIRNPFINFKISGSLTLRKYGKVFRSVTEDLHDIDGVIPLEIFRQEPSAREFMGWLREEGMPMMRSKQGKKFYRQATKWVEKMVWYQNMKNTIPGFSLENIFVGRDHKNGESVTIQGKATINGKEYKFDFFLRTDEGRYPEIFDNYWKDWKQIFEAKLNMGRSKDISDLIYFDPYIEDKFKFTNKGFRYFVFEQHDVNTQLEDVPASTASDETIKLVKEAAKKMGIDIQSLADYARQTGLDTTSLNGVADLVRGIIAVAENKENVALTEEMVHIATAILEQTNPKLVTEMISKIDQFKIYKTVLEKYKNNKYYQLANGKPDIRKIKKEAVDKLIAELIINQNEGSTEFPELMQEEKRSFVQNIWRKIKSWFSSKYKAANIDIFREAAKVIISGEVGAAYGRVRPGVQELFDANPELANQVYEALGFKKSLSSITPKTNIVDYRTMDNKSKEDALNGVEEAQKRWIEEEIAEFYEAIYQFNNGLDTFSSKGVNKGKATMDDVIDETLGIFRTIQMFPKFSNYILPYLDDIKTALNTFGREEGYAIYKAKKDAKNQAKEMTYENLFEVVDKYIKPNDVNITPQQKQQALQQYSAYLDSIFPNSKVRDIVYHGTNADFEEFFEDSLNYFTISKNVASVGGKFGGKVKNIIPAVLEIRKPFYEDGGNLSLMDYAELEDQLDRNNSDGYISLDNRVFVPQTSEQIHILGNEQDLNGFREFVKTAPAPFKGEGVFFQLSDVQKNIQQKILSTTDRIEKKEGDTTAVDPLLSDTEEASNFYERTKSDGTLAKVRNRVTDRVKAWYKEVFGNKQFTEQEKKFNELKREFGVKGHLDLEEIHGRYFNSDGTRKSKPDVRPKKFNVESQDVYDKLEKYYVDLIKTFPKDTIVMSEVIIYDPNQDEAGTIDFLAIEPSGKTHILDWKFMHIRGDDVAWFKQGAFNIQLKRYKEILKDHYGVTNFGMNRAIPISMEFGLKNRLNPDMGFKVRGIAIGSANPADIEDIKLIPIAEETESTGDEDLDDLIKKLNALLKQVESQQVGEDEKQFKIERLNVLRQAIRIIQATKNIAPVIDIIEVMRKEGERILNDYSAVYKNRPATSADSKNPELSDFAEDMNNYIKTSEVFINIGRDIGHLIYSSDMDKEAKTKKQKENLKQRKEAAEKLNEESDAIYRSSKKILEASREFADKHIGQRNLVTGLLNPEKVIKGLSSTFRGISELPSAALSILYKLTQVATMNASADSLKEVEKLMDIRKRIMARGGDPRRFVQKLYQKDDKGKIVNKLIHKFSKEFRETVDNKFNQGGDRKWLLDNIDVDAYMEEAKAVITKRIEQIKKQNYPGTKEEVAKQRKKAIEKVLKQYDIKRLDFDGGNNYIIKKHPLPKWYSAEYSEVRNDADLNELFNYVSAINEKAKDVGYINNMIAKTFLPFVRKSMAESFAWDNVLTAMGKWNDDLKLRVEDVGYGNINEITGELENSIPKYYTHDFTQTENGVNDYSDVSEDLFKNLILYTQQVNKYKYLSEVEGQIKMVKTIEEFKTHHLATDRNNKLVFKGSDPEKLAGNKENAKMFDEFMRAILYGQKYVLTDSDTPLYIGKVLEFIKAAVNKVTGKEVFKPKEKVTPTSLIKTIDAANRAFQVKTLGLEVIPGLVNLFGGNMQMATQAGHYFKFGEFAKNERKILNMEFVNDEDKKIFVEMLNEFMPMRDDPASELYKEAGMTKLTNSNLGDMLMITMRYPEQLMEKATFFTLLENMMVVNGKIISIREYVKSKNRDRYASASRANEAKQKMEAEIEELKKTKSIAVTRKLENGKLVIPGLDMNNRQELQRLTKLARRISRTAMGAAADGDVTRASMSIWLKSMMVFKGWIPKLLDTRFSEFRKISDDFSIEVKEGANGEVITEGEKYDIGRLRLLSYVMMRSFQEKGTSIVNILKLNEKGLEAMDDMYNDFAKTYYERTGETLNMTKEDFIDMVHNNLRNQIRELITLALMIASSIALGYMAPDDDEDKAAKNAFRYTERVLDKFTSELSFFYNPLEMEKLLSGNAFPAIGLITDITKFLSHFFMQITGFDLSDPTKSYDEVRESAKPIKYAAKSLPVFKSALTYGAIISSDFAKEFDITIQKETMR